MLSGAVFITICLPKDDICGVCCFSFSFSLLLHVFFLFCGAIRCHARERADAVFRFLLPLLFAHAAIVAADAAARAPPARAPSP